MCAVLEARGISGNKAGFPVRAKASIWTDGEHRNTFQAPYSFHLLFPCNNQPRKLEILARDVT